MKEKFLSVIIITLNEEKYLPRLLESFVPGLDEDVEVIVSDNHSIDRTVEIAKEYGCRIQEEGGSPASGRNAGAEVASGKYLFFSDSDNELPENFIKDLKNEIIKKDVEFASGFLTVKSNKFIDRIFLFTTNWFYYLTQKIHPYGFGPYMVCRRDIFEKAGGFNEKMRVFEDNEFINRLGKQYRYTFLKNPRIIFSIRRFEKEGRLKTTARYLYWPIHHLFFGEKTISGPLGGYKFFGEVSTKKEDK